MKQSAKRRTSPTPRSTCPSSSAPAFEVMFPPSKPATTERRSTASNSNSFGVHSVCIGAHLGSWRNRCCTTILSDSQPRCTAHAGEIWASRLDAGGRVLYAHGGEGLRRRSGKPDRSQRRHDGEVDRERESDRGACQAPSTGGAASWPENSRRHP